MRLAPWIACGAVLGTAVVIGLGARTGASALQSRWQDEATRALATAGIEGVDPRVEGRELRLRGAIGDETQRREVHAAVTALAGIDRIVDELQVADESVVSPVAPIETAPSASPQPQPAARPASGSSPDDAVASAQPSTERPPSPWQKALQTVHGSTIRCQEELDRLVAREGIHFDAFSAAISPQSRPVLDTIAEVLAGCPRVVIEISGHADGQGSAELNDSLSRARAASVRQALVRRGVAASRLVAVGHGDRLPVADDATEEGRHRNRRIEFRVREDE